MNDPSLNSGQPQVLDEIRRALGRSETVRPAPLEPFIEAVASQGSDEILALFTREVTAVGGHVQRAENGEEVAASIAQICHEAGVTEVALSGAPLLAEISLESQLAARKLVAVRSTDFLPDERERLIARLASCGAGVTAIDYAIAETGTLVISSDEEHGLIVSLLPPIHIAVLRRQQIIESMAAVVGKVKADLMGRARPCRAATFITGPSRTGDIELTLSIGVHGPKELHLIII